MDGTILGQGSFVVATGVPAVVVKIPSGADFMWVKNFTQYGANSAATGVNYYWQRGMAAGTGIVEYKNSSAALLGDTLVSGGFTLYDPSGNPLASSIAYSAITNSTQPTISTASTAGLVSNVSIVRLSLQSGDTALANAVSGIDFAVGTVVLNTSFQLKNVMANAVGSTTGTGHWRLVQFDPLFYPRRRVIVNITQAVQAVVTTSIPHGFTPGQEVRFNIPAVSGMVQLNATPQNNYLVATIVSISSTDLCVFTINVDTTAFTAFTFPTVAQQPSSFPEVTPVGEDTGFALTSPTIQVPGVASSTVGAQINDTNVGILADSTVNTGFLGMVLGTGGNGNILGSAITGPAGSVAADVMYWVAGKSTYGGL